MAEVLLDRYYRLRNFNCELAGAPTADELCDRKHQEHDAEHNDRGGGDDRIDLQRPQVRRWRFMGTSTAQP